MLAGCGGAQPGVGSSGSTSAGTRAFEVVVTFTAESLGLNRPAAMALGPDGNIYLTDYGQRVSVISPDGRVLRRWGTPGGGAGQFHFAAPDHSDPTWVPGHLTVGSDGSVYVSDSGNARVQVFTPDGRFVRQFGSFGPTDAQLLMPYDLTVDDAGHVFVEDDQRQRLTRFSAAGAADWVIGGLSNDPDLRGHFHPGMVDRHGRLLVTNDDNGRILYIDASGHKVDAFGGSGPLVKDGPCDISVDDRGYTYISPCLPDSTYVYDPSHELVASWPASEGELETAPRFGADGVGFALRWDGAVIVVRATLGRS
ncbi:MAG: NHL repeat-containing protein [Lapillicoccus sp.]